MSEEQHADDPAETEADDGSVNRRNVLKKMGVATAATALPLSAMGTASADNGDGFEIGDGDATVKELSGSAERKARLAAYQCPGFTRLVSYFASNFYRITDINDTNTYKVTGKDGTSYTIVGFETEYVGPSGGKGDSDNRAAIAIRLQDGARCQARGSRTVREDGEPDRLQFFTVENGQVNVEEMDINPSSGPTNSSNEVSVQATTKCRACQAVYRTACRVGCNVGAVVICGIATITTVVGGIACSAIAVVVCDAIRQRGCGRRAITACRNIRFRRRRLCRR